MKKGARDYVVAVVGILILAVGFVLLKAIADPQGALLALPYICIGLGCGAFGHGVGNIIACRAVKSYPDIQKQIEIEKNDERNISITNRAKAKAYDVMMFVFGALMLSFGLMGVELVAILFLVFAYLFVVFYWIYYQNKLSKEM